VSTTTPSGIDAIREMLLPEVDQLLEFARHEEKRDQLQFFERIRNGIEAASEPDDLAGPFMELSTSAFLGFVFSAAVQLQLDRVLAYAQQVSFTLSADGDTPH